MLKVRKSQRQILISSKKPFLNLLLKLVTVCNSVTVFFQGVLSICFELTLKYESAQIKFFSRLLGSPKPGRNSCMIFILTVPFSISLLKRNPLTKCLKIKRRMLDRFWFSILMGSLSNASFKGEKIVTFPAIFNSWVISTFSINALKKQNISCKVCWDWMLLWQNWSSPVSLHYGIPGCGVFKGGIQN